MNGNSRDRLLRDLQDEEARAAYVEGHVRAGVAYQIRAMRDAEGWSQTELGQEMGNTPQAAQAAVARLENPDYGRFSVSTLLAVASAFDVALMVRFVSYSDLVRHVTDAPPSALSPVVYTNDVSVQPQPPALEGKIVINVPSSAAAFTMYGTLHLPDDPSPYKLIRSPSRTEPTTELYGTG